GATTPDGRTLAGGTALRTGTGGYRRAGRGDRGRAVAARPVHGRDRGCGRRVRRDERAVAAGDQAVERPRPPVLGVERVHVRGVPGVRVAVDVRQPPRLLQYRRWAAAVGARSRRGRARLRLPVGTVRRARPRAL